MTPRISLLITALLLMSCTDETVNNFPPGTVPGPTTSGIPVTDDPRTILPYSEMSLFTKGTVMKLRVNRTGSVVEEIPVIFDAVYREGIERLILCHTMPGTPVGSGDSGSPLMTSDGKIAGVLCYGYYYNSNDFIARAVEDVLAIDTLGTSSTTTSGNYTVMHPTVITTGILTGAMPKYSRLSSLLGTAPSSIGPLARFTRSQKITAAPIAGNSISVDYISGDVVSSSAIGTLSYHGTERSYAFGHSYYTFLAAPVRLAQNKAFITTGGGSFKMAEPTAERIGACVRNTANGILILNNTAPLAAALITTFTVDGSAPFTYHHFISNTPDFRYDQSLASDLSCYLLYTYLYDQGRSNDSLHADCTLTVETEKGTQTRPLNIFNNDIDWRIYYTLANDTLAVYKNAKYLKRFDLSMTVHR